MAETKRGQAQSERAKAREGRRSSLTQPFEELDEAATGGGEGSSDTAEVAKRAARKAAAAAIAGGLAGAAKALLDRRGRSHDEDEDPEEAAQDEQPEDRSSSASEPEHDTDATANDEPAGESADEEREEREEASDRSEPDEPQQGASRSDVAAMVKRARTQITDLLGKEPESISGVEQANGSWSVNVEVVEIHRIPDTTDILSSYEVVLDDDGNLVRLERQRRYRRAQVEEDR